MQLVRRLLIKHHVSESVGGIGNAEQVGELAARLGSASDRNQLAAAVLTESGFGRINHVAQLLRQLSVT